MTEPIAQSPAPGSSGGAPGTPAPGSSGGAPADGHGAHEHSEHLAHHFESTSQQFETGKLGMWIFLATEILMFGGLFCVYAIYRGNHPQVFLYAHRFLDWKLGAINTVVLLTSSMTMAWAVRAAMLGHKKVLITMLFLTLLGGVGFLSIKFVEYATKFHSDLYPGPANAYYNADEANKELGLQGDDAITPEGRKYRIYNIENHYLGKYGVHHEVPEAYRTERYAYHPHDNADAQSHVTHESHTQDHATPEHDAETRDGADPALPTVEKTLHEPVATGPSGLAASVLNPDEHDHAQGASHQVWTYDTLPASERARIHIFYQIYFFMTGLHGLHVIIGMGLITWILIKGLRGTFGPKYYVPVDIVGLYWHLVDLIWIFLFPLLYLIH